MKIAEYKEDYYHFTGKLSDINRNMALAGIAIVWLFKKGESDEIRICTELIMPLIIFAVSLSLDMIQYIYQSLLCFIAYKKFDKKHKNDPNKKEIDVEHPEKYNIPTWIFFWIKILTMILGYIYIINFLKELLYS